MNGLIYIATHSDSGKVYVGQTSDFKVRLYQHLHPMRKTYFSRALLKYGIKQFIFQLISCPINELNTMENILIEELESKNPGGFNLTDGGDGMRGWHPSEETKKKISLSGMGNKIWIGKHHSEESKLKMREAKKGRALSPEHRKKLSLVLMGNKRSVGRIVNNETRKKISMAGMGRKMSARNKEILRAIATGRIVSEETRRKMSDARKSYYTTHTIWNKKDNANAY